MRTTLSIMILSVFLTSTAKADKWPGWRGPTSNGVAAGKDFPTKWSTTENVAWKVAIPGHGTSTPIVWEDHLFVTYNSGGKNYIVCFDHKGKKRWTVEIGSERKAKNRKGSGANPSPTTDGKHVYVYYKSGDFACLDFEGKMVWQKNLQKEFGKDTLWWDLGTSPVLTKDLVVVACMQSGSSYLAGFDKKTGKEVWKQDRELGAPVEAAQSYSTPMVVQADGKEIIVLVGADHVTANDAATGKELWRAGGLNPKGNKFFRSISSVVVSDGVAIAPYARGATLTAIRLGGSGDVTKTHVAWVKQGISADVPTPAAVDGKVYVCTDKGKVACLDIKTGEEIWSKQLKKGRYAFSSSPILADGKLYVTREDGTTFVMEGSEVLQTNSLEDFTVASPVFTQNKILIRTRGSLYCIGK